MTKVEVCNICGHSGYLNAIIFCSECPVTVAHLYCLGITPGSIDDTFDWVCEYCSTSLECSLPNPWKFGDASTLRKCTGDAETLKAETTSEEFDGTDQPQPLCFLLPLSYHESSKQAAVSNQFQIAEETARTASFMRHLLKIKEEEEGPVSSFMRYPKSIPSGLVLLVSPSGEIIINDPQITDGNPSPVQSCMASIDMKTPQVPVFCVEQPEIITEKERSFLDYPHSRGFASSNLNNPSEVSSDKLAKQQTPCGVKLDVSCTNKANDIVNECGEIVRDCDTEEPMELDESDLQPDETIDACHPDEFGDILKSEGCTGTKVQDDAKVISDHSVRSSILRHKGGWALKSSDLLKEDRSRDHECGDLENSLGRRKRGRPLEFPNWTEEDATSDVEVGNKDKSHASALQRAKSKRQKLFDCSEDFVNKARDTSTRPVDDLRIEIPFKTALSVEAEKESILKQIVDLFRSAGWTVKWMQSRHSKNRKCQTRVFIHPKGRMFWSAGKAYEAVQREALEGTIGSSPSQVENYFNIKVSLETALIVWADRDSIRMQVEEMLLGVGWKFEYRGSKRVYMSPEGEAYWSFIEAHSVLKLEVVQGKGEVKASIAYLNSIKTLILNMLAEAGWTVQNRSLKGSSKQTVYVNPEGKYYTSVHQAYYAFQRGV